MKNVGLNPGITFKATRAQKIVDQAGFVIPQRLLQQTRNLATETPIKESCPAIKPSLGQTVKTLLAPVEKFARKLINR